MPHGQAWRKLSNPSGDGAVACERADVTVLLRNIRENSLKIEWKTTKRTGFNGKVSMKFPIEPNMLNSLKTKN
jgi:hypothetical protein